MKLAQWSGVVFSACLALISCGAISGPPPEPPPIPAESGTWSQLPPGPLTARHEALGAHLNGVFYVVGGWSEPPCPPSAGCLAPIKPAQRDGATFDPKTGLWESISPAPTPLSGIHGMIVVDGKLYLLTGDVGRDDSPNTFLSYDPTLDAWATLPLPPGENVQLVAAGSQVIAIGGSDEAGPALDSVYESTANRWKRLPDDPLGPSLSRSAVWLDDQLLVVGTDLVPNPGSKGPSLTRLAVLDASSSGWAKLADSDIIGGHPVWVHDRVVFPMTGSEKGGAVGNWGREYAYGAIFDPASSAWVALPCAPVGRSGLGGAIGNVGTARSSTVTFWNRRPVSGLGCRGPRGGVRTEAARRSSPALTASSSGVVPTAVRI